MLSITGTATLQSLSLSRAGSEDSPDTLATLKLEIETTDLEPVRAALGIEEPDPLAWAWSFPETPDGSGECERRYVRMGPIATPGATWLGKHAVEIGGYREIRPSKVVVESVMPVHNGIWLIALKVQVEKAPAGAVEAWAMFLRQAGGLRIALVQDADLFDEAGGDSIKGAVKRFSDRMARQGTTVTISGGGRSVTLGSGARAASCPATAVEGLSRE